MVLLLGTYVCPCRDNALSDKWRERTMVSLSPLITWCSKVRTSWSSNTRPSDPSNTMELEEMTSEPKASNNEQTASTFYVPTTSDSALATDETYTGSYRSNTGEAELLQYRVELRQE